MVLKNILWKPAILSIAFFSLIACDNDFKEVGAGIVDSGNFEALLYDQVALSSTNKELEKVQTNRLSSYALGVYNDGAFGVTTADIVAQFALSQTNPSFGENPVLDSVVLNLPYFSSVEDETSENPKYVLDSVYGDQPFKLSVYQSGYALRDYDPSNDYDPQAYYSDDVDKIEQNIVGGPLVVKEDFRPSARRIVVQDLSGDEDASPKYQSPAIHFKLPKEFFKNLIFKKQGEAELSSHESFLDYFRGLYFKVESPQGQGSYSLLNFGSEDAGITMYYHNEEKGDDGKKVKRYHSFKLNAVNRMINLMHRSGGNMSFQNDRLYVKGGVGVLSYIDLFRDPEQLDSLRHAGWLINEANLKLYVDQKKLASGYEFPQRIFVYDYKNGRVLKDYTNSTDIKDNDILESRVTHLGKLSEDDDGNLFYKIRLTDYIDEVLNKGATNTRLGIVVSQNVNEDSFVNAVTQDGQVVRIPRSAVVTRNGAVFFGEKGSSDKALKLEIYYTKSTSN